MKLNKNWKITKASEMYNKLFNGGTTYEQYKIEKNKEYGKFDNRKKESE